MRLQKAPPGLTFTEVNGGRVTTYGFDADVLEAKHRIEQEFDVRVLWDNERHEHLIVQTEYDGTQSLVFATKTFYEEEIRKRLYDAQTGDVLDKIDAHNAALEADQDRRFSDQMGDVGERLAHAFAKDGLTVRPKVFIPNGL